MKVTKAMVERAAASMRTDFALDTDDAARAALETALADVPEPSVNETLLRNSREAHYQAVALVNQRDARIAELEAQLGKVRRWMADDIKWRAIFASKEEDT